MKNLPFAVKVVTAYNIIQVIVMTFIVSQNLNFDFMLFFFLFGVVFVLISNYFLIKGKRAAWIALFIWYILITLKLELSFFSWTVVFGLTIPLTGSLSIGSMEIVLGADILSLIILLIHARSKNNFQKIEENKLIEED